MGGIREMGIAALLSLAVAFVPAIMGTAYAIWPTERRLALMRPLSLAGLFSGLGGLAIGAVNALAYAGRHNPQTPFPMGPFLTGIAESIVPLGAAFGSLTIGWLLVAVGMRRQA